MSALRGYPEVAPQEIFTSSATQGTDLGAFFQAGDGRCYRYILNGTTALIAGKLIQTVAQDTTNFANLGVSTAAGTSTTTVSTGSSVTLTANQLTGGILTTRSGQGKGYTYRIKSHPAVTAGTVSFVLEDALQIALATTSTFDATPNPYSAVIQWAATGSAVAIGVATAATPASQYGWVQTHGACAVLSDGATFAGRSVSPSMSVAGAVTASSGGTQTLVGYSMNNTTDTQYGLTYLTID